MEERRKLKTTLTLIIKGNRILLGEKKRGYAKGTFNGIGGKQDPGETIEQTMIRETQEEIGITPTKYELVGKIDFINFEYKGERIDNTLSIYKCSDFEGEICETEEMIPNWFEIDKMPYDRMLPDDVLWFPLVLGGKHIKVKMVFDENMQKSSYEIYEVKDNNFDKSLNLIKTL